MKYYSIKKWSDFDINMKKIMKNKGALICEIFMDPEQYFHPKLGTSLDKNGKIISPPLEDLSPIIKRSKLKENMIIPIHKKSKMI